jgi:hypothetical protein
MPFYIRDNEATATRRRVPLYIYADTAGTAWAGSVTGVKARLSVNGAAEADTAADIVRVAGSYHYAQLSQAEVNVAPGDIIHVRVPAVSGRLEAFAVCEIGADDIFAAAPTDSSIATAVDAIVADNFAAIPAAVATSVWAAGTRELTTISASIREAIADTLLGRTIAGAANGGRTVTSALRALRNRVTRVGATLTVFAEDDTTTAYTAALTTDTNAATITGVDPS